jgi:hypothetical protein
MIHHVTDVVPLEGQRLRLRFDTDEVKVFDVAPFLDRGRFALLRDSDLFRQARVAYGTVEWPGDLDLDPEDLYRYSTPV